MQKLIGGILLAVGALIAAGSGLCTLAVVGSSLASPNEWTGGGAGGMFGGFMIVLLFGGIPFAIGVGLFLLGRRMVRAAEPAKESPADMAEEAASADPGPAKKD
jgi:hypothetical protein